MAPRHATHVLNIAAAGMLAWHLLAPAYHHRSPYGEGIDLLPLQSSTPHVRTPFRTMDAVPDAETYLACMAALDAMEIESPCLSSDPSNERS